MKCCKDDNCNSYAMSDCSECLASKQDNLNKTIPKETIVFKCNKCTANGSTTEAVCPHCGNTDIEIIPLNTSEYFYHK